MSLLDELDEEVRSRCLVRIAPTAEQLNTWNESPFRKFLEQYQVRILPDEYQDLLRNALEEWRGRERRAIGLVPGAAEDDEIFEKWFNQARSAFVNGEPEGAEALQEMGMYLQGGWAVQHYGWVELLAVYLPQAAGPDKGAGIAVHGRRAAGLFYMEQVDRLVSSKVHTAGQAAALARTDAAWCLASQWSQPGHGIIAPTLGISHYEAICERYLGALLDPFS